jgi:glycosyltransferase involved in cell wall biosynthesis
MSRILFCHNYYKQAGGEDVSNDDEIALLRSRGHDVSTYTLHNDFIDQMGSFAVARKTIWNHKAFRELRKLIRHERPEIMHCTNLFPLISPAAYFAARAEGVAVVQALRNFRLLCPNTFFLRDGRVCEDCLGKSLPWRAVAHGCYRNNRAASAVVTAMLGVHNGLKTWTRSIDRFLCPSQFARQKFVEAGYPEDRLHVIPNFVDIDTGPGSGQGNYAVYVGRLSHEKDLRTLLAAWSQLDNSLKLKVIGDGPLADLVLKAEKESNVEWLGHRSKEEVLSAIGDATFLVMPSIWYETFGRVIVEAYSKGTPVIVSNLGAMAELVTDGHTGLRFDPGNPTDLISKVRDLLSDPNRLSGMRSAARYEMLINMYQAARDHYGQLSHATC